MGAKLLPFGPDFIRAVLKTSGKRWRYKEWFLSRPFFSKLCKLPPISCHFGPIRRIDSGAIAADSLLTMSILFVALEFAPTRRAAFCVGFEDPPHVELILFAIFRDQNKNFLQDDFDKKRARNDFGCNSTNCKIFKTCTCKKAQICDQGQEDCRSTQIVARIRLQILMFIFLPNKIF